jgi:hypothetical protein
MRGGFGGARERQNAELFFQDLMGATRRAATPREWSRGDASEAKPSYLVTHTFLSHSVEVNPVMQRRLTDTQQAIQRAFDALAPDHPSRVHVDGRQRTLGQWAGISSARGWRSGSSTSKHASGSAVDLNYALQPYIVTRTIIGGQTTLGGEAAGASLQTQRRHAADVYDRSVRFTSRSADAMTLIAPMHVRATGESTQSAYRRLLGVSNAMSRYFRYAILEQPIQVRRRPVANIEAATESQLLAAIPLTERRDEAEAIGELAALMDPQWSRAHANWGLTPRQTYLRILKDYEHARIPWVIGNPVARPGRTRNPARGFLHIREEVVVALTDVGRLRWGAIDFGPHFSGDVHHFDLGNHGGYTPDGRP